MEVLVAISRFTEVNFFLMNPCGEFWGDILTDRQMGRAMDRGAPRGLTAEDLHLEKGNSLLASMGRLGREFFDLVNWTDGDVEPFSETFRYKHIFYYKGTKLFFLSKDSYIDEPLPEIEEQ